MPKLIDTRYNLQDSDFLKDLQQHAINNLKEIEVIYYPNENAIDASFMGQQFETTNCSHPSLDDRILLDPPIHGGIRNEELKYLGAIFQINDIENITPSYNTANYCLSPDYIMWSVIINEPIQVQFSIEHSALINKISYSGTRHLKTLEALKADPNITILDAGIMDAGDLAYTRNQFNQFNSQVAITVNQFGPIEVMLNVGFPDTVNDLVDIVKKYKSQLFKMI